MMQSSHVRMEVSSGIAAVISKLLPVGTVLEVVAGLVHKLIQLIAWVWMMHLTGKPRGGSRIPGVGRASGCLGWLFLLRVAVLARLCFASAFLRVTNVAVGCCVV